MRTPLRKSHGKITLVLYNKPNPCGGKCLYCFTSKGFTKSTTPNEDTELAKNNDWSGNKQIEKRFERYGLVRGSGIKCDFAVKGDSFASHDEEYLRQYTKELYDFLNGKESASLMEAAALQRNAPDRCVTYKVETRPDQIDDSKCRFFMELGVTTVEIGVQSLDDGVLAFNERGHDTQAVKQATRLLRKYGFEVCYQMMVGLPGSNRAIDKQMLVSTLWQDEYAPDAIKIYPCLLLDQKIVSQRRLRNLHKQGLWTPVAMEDYISLLWESFSSIPRWVHINRIQRIIQADKIEAGISEEICRKFFDPVSTCLWQRSPAQRLNDLEQKGIDHCIESHSQGLGRLCFEAIHRQDVVVGYGRLDKISDRSALIRDIRTSGNMLPVGTNNLSRRGCQHIGIGSSILEAMEIKVRETGGDFVFVRPSFGTVSWFEKRGYEKMNNYFYGKRVNPTTKNDFREEFKIRMNEI